MGSSLPTTPSQRPCSLRRGPLYVSLLALLVSPLQPATRARADDAGRGRGRGPEARLQPRDELWLSVSATLLTAGLAGTFALKVAALHDRSAALPANSPERPGVDRDAADARRYAWGFGTAAALLSLTSLLVWVYQPLAAEPARARATRFSPVLSTTQLGVLCRGHF